jgi:hypothetical protein
MNLHYFTDSDKARENTLQSLSRQPHRQAITGGMGARFINAQSHFRFTKDLKGI